MVLLEGGGREVLEVARKRLTAANLQATAAKQMLASAQSMYDAAEKERKDAQSSLDEAEKKYEVINIDDDVDDQPMNSIEGSNKRRKVSLSPQANNSRNNTIPSIAFTSSSSNTTNNLSNNSNNSGSDRVLVSGCGYPGVNGTYKQENGSLYEGAPLFTKQMGPNTLAIYRVPSNQKYWYIGQWNINTNSEASPSFRLYKSNLYTRESKLIPPENGWVSCGASTSQRVPKCKFLSHAAASSAAATAVNELVVSGCGVSMANGTYKRAVTTYQGLPMYIKTGQVTFHILCAFNERYQQWKIRRSGARHCIYTCKEICRIGDRLDGAPFDTIHWHLTGKGDGLNPPPQVKRGRMIQTRYGV